MQNPRLAARYSKSVLDLAVERNSLDGTLKDMQTLSSICSMSPDFVVMLRSPVIKGDKKLKVINEIINTYGVGELTHAFISLLINKGRERNLPEIATAFIAQYNELKNIRTVKVTTAIPMSDVIKKSIEAKVSGYMPNGTIELETEVDESLIGGFVMELEGKLYDASVKKSLNDIRTKITDSSYAAKM